MILEFFFFTERTTTVLQIDLECLRFQFPSIFLQFCGLFDHFRSVIVARAVLYSSSVSEESVY